jgi:DNA polymerase-3 subunit beta
MFFYRRACMELRIQRKEFLRGLGMVQTIIERRSTIPILSNTLIRADYGGVTLTATDLETAIRGHFPASVIVEGESSISARKLFEIVRELPEAEIHLKKNENNWVTLTCKKAVFNIAGINPDEFPPLPSFSQEDFIPFQSAQLKEMIENTVFAASTEESRYNLNGVFLKKIVLDNQPVLRMVATDGHRLALFEQTGIDFPKMEKGVIIPKKGVTEIKKLVADIAIGNEGKSDLVYLSLSENNLIAKKDGLIILTRLIDGQFPDYEQVIPKQNDKKSRIPREQFAACLKRVSTMASEKGEGIILKIRRSQMELSSSSQDFGDAKEEIDIDYDGEELIIGFNARYVLDALASMKTEEVLIELKDEASAGIFRPVGQKGQICIVMPMKL